MTSRISDALNTVRVEWSTKAIPKTSPVSEVRDRWTEMPLFFRMFTKWPSEREMPNANPTRLLSLPLSRALRPWLWRLALQRTLAREKSGSPRMDSGTGSVTGLPLWSSPWRVMEATSPSSTIDALSP